MPKPDRANHTGAALEQAAFESLLTAVLLCATGETSVPPNPGAFDVAELMSRPGTLPIRSEMPLLG